MALHQDHQAYGLLTPNEIVQRLMALGRDLETAVTDLRDAEISAVRLRHAADLAESRAFVSAEGPMDMRRHLARIAAADPEDVALVAEATVRYLRARIHAIDLRIEVGRSMGAAVRSEMKMLPYDANA